MSTDRILTGILKLPEAIRGLVIAWDTFDDDLREHYANELEWLLEVAREDRWSEADRTRIESCLVELRKMQDDITRTFGVTVRS